MSIEHDKMEFDLGGTSPAAASTVAGTGVAHGAGWMSAFIRATLLGATGGTLDVYVQGWDGVAWVDVVHFPQLAAGAAAVSYTAKLSSGEGNGLVPVVVGKDATPALAVNVVVPGAWGDRLRVVYVAGAGTSAGAVQVVRVVLQGA